MPFSGPGKVFGVRSTFIRAAIEPDAGLLFSRGHVDDRDLADPGAAERKGKARNRSGRRRQS